MGDRANVLVKDDANDSGVYLYTHWDGGKLPKILQAALQKKWRWDDAAYLTRIIFCEMVKDNLNEETGYGISNTPPDGDDRVIEVNSDTLTVCRLLGNERSEKEYSFEAFCTLSPEALENFWHNTAV